MNTTCLAKRQRGAASVLIALILMMAITLITLSVMRSHLTDTRMTNNENWSNRFRLLAQSEWEKSVNTLTQKSIDLRWQASSNGKLVSRHATNHPVGQMVSRVTYSKSDESSRFVQVNVVSGHSDNSKLSGKITQYVRLLTALSPLAESAPPLVLNGCLGTGSNNIAIRPLNSDRDNAGDAIWLFDNIHCPPLNSIDKHGGPLIQKTLKDSFWQTIFSITPDEYVMLSEMEAADSHSNKRYWLADEADLINGRWTYSLGSAEKPVILVFPETQPCPEFADGVMIVGVVYIDMSCMNPLNRGNLEITGTLAINGNGSAHFGKLRLNHIQVEDSRHSKLSFPVLRGIKIPGTWRDF